MEKEELLRKFLKDRIKLINDEMKLPGAGVFLSGLAVGQWRLAKEILEILDKKE